MYHLDGWSQDHFFINRFFFLISISVHFRLALGCVHVFIFFSAGLARVINSPHGIWSGHHAVTWSVIRLWTDDLIAVGSSNARFDLRTPPRPTLGNDCKSVYLCWIGFFISSLTRNKGGKHSWSDWWTKRDWCSSTSTYYELPILPLAYSKFEPDFDLTVVAIFIAYISILIRHYLLNSFIKITLKRISRCDTRYKWWCVYWMDIRDFYDYVLWRYRLDVRTTEGIV